MIKIKYFLIVFFTLIIFNTIVNVLAREKKKLDFVKVEQAYIDTEEIELVKKKIHSIITKIEKGEYYKFTKGNTENDIVVKIDVTHQIDIQKQIKKELGFYVGLEFEALFKSKTQNPIMNKIYLFKAYFGSKKDAEIRVFLNNKREIVNLNMISWEKEIYIY